MSLPREFLSSLHRMLGRLEWKNDGYCISCEGHRDEGHRDKCELKAFLDASWEGRTLDTWSLYRVGII